MNTALPHYPGLSWSPLQEPLQSTVYLNYVAVEYNVSFPQATRELMFPFSSLALDVWIPKGT